MELRVQIEFSADEKDHSSWTEIITGLDAGKQGAWLEERLEYFGAAVSAELEKLMDDCEANYETVWFESGVCDDDRFRIVMVGGYGVIDCLPRIASLLEHCAVSQLLLNPEVDE